MANPVTGAETVRWNFDLLYKGVDDPAIDAAVAQWTEAAKAFDATHRGKLATTLGQALRAMADMSTMAMPALVYLYLRTSTNTADAPAKAKMAALSTTLSAVSADHLEFFNHELVALPEQTIADLAAKDEFVARHMPLIREAMLGKPYLLPEQIESALTKRAPFGSGSWAEFFDEVEADLRFDFNGEQKSLTEMLHVMNEDPDGNVRAAAMKLVNDGLGGHFVKYSAQTLYMTAGACEVENVERKYKHPMQSRNLSSQLPDEVVDALHEAVIGKASALGQRFYRLKAKLLGKPTLAWSDRNAPLPFSDTSTMPWQKAVDIVLAAYRSFSPTLAGLVQKMLDDGWIDAPAMKGRAGGAYNYTVPLSGGRVAAYTFLNYLGTPRDVMTLAHEVGHGVHGVLGTLAQGPLMYHAPIALCETASVFGEMTTFNYLKAELLKSGDKQALLALIMDKLDDVTNTVVRQIQFSNFERRLHGWNPATKAWGKVAKRSAEECDALWLETLAEMYGKEGEVFTYENVSHLWSYISHFHRPFYVYGYAFGELLTQSLYAARPRLGEKFEPLYLEMLRAGGSKNFKELTEPFGLNPTDPRFWTDGLDISMGAMVAEAEALAKDLGLVTA